MSFRVGWSGDQTADVLDLLDMTLDKAAYAAGDTMTARLNPRFKGKATVVGRKSEHSLYSKQLATYDEGSSYDQAAAQGFIKIHGLGQQTQARQQLLKGGRGFELPGLLEQR